MANKWLTWVLHKILFFLAFCGLIGMGISVWNGLFSDCSWFYTSRSSFKACGIEAKIYTIIEIFILFCLVSFLRNKYFSPKKKSIKSAHNKANTTIHPLIIWFLVGGCILLFIQLIFMRFFLPH